MDVEEKIKKSRKRELILVVSAFVVLALGIALTLGLTLGLNRTREAPPTVRALTDADKLRVDCYPEAQSVLEEVNKALCESRGCIFDDSAPDKVPKCYHNEGSAYRAGNEETTTWGKRWILTRTGASLYSADNSEISAVSFEYEERGDQILRFKVSKMNMYYVQ